MRELKQVKSAELFPLVKEILDTGGSVKIAVTGISMYPFLFENRDSVELIKCDFSEIKRGDIALARQENGQYFLHRVWRKQPERFYMVGDGLSRIDGPYVPDQLIAIVGRVWRKERVIDSSSLAWRTAGLIWLLLRPLRGAIFAVYGTLKRVVRKNHKHKGMG